MGIGMLRREYDATPEPVVSPAVAAPAPAVAEATPAQVEVSLEVSPASTKTELRNFLIAEMGDLTEDQEAMTKNELVEFIFGSES